MTTVIFGLVLPWLLITAGTWLTYQLARQNGRILLRLEAIFSILSWSLRLKKEPRQARESPCTFRFVEVRR